MLRRQAIFFIFFFVLFFFLSVVQNVERCNYDLQCRRYHYIVRASFSLDISMQWLIDRYKRNLKMIVINKKKYQMHFFRSHKHFSFWIGLRLKTRIIARQWKGKREPKNSMHIWYEVVLRSRNRFDRSQCTIIIGVITVIGAVAWDMRHEAWFSLVRFCRFQSHWTNLEKPLMKNLMRSRRQIRIWFLIGAKKSFRLENYDGIQYPSIYMVNVELNSFRI